ncbi:MAG: TRAP transporter small permease [Alphaproteobacteria bacterium]|nr:TRAP transporter small permease [Alphaproteobacteria bacterium]
MTGTRGAWRRLTAACHRILSFLLVVSVLILVIPVTLQIFSRFTSLLPHYIWTEEMARFLFVWMVMIGAMVGVRESAHFDVDLWPRMGRRGTAAVNIVSRVAVLVFALTFVVAGWEFTEFAFNRISELAELPLWLIHVAWPLTGVVWLVFLGEQLWDDLRTLFGGFA